MTRLTSIEKGGYYEFPEQHLPAVASLFMPSKSGGKLLDPCAGEGKALDFLAKAWNLTPYANELDDSRAAVCKLLFGAGHSVQGDMYQLKASNDTFSVVWSNPPYSWDSTGDEKRREFGMMKYAWKWVQQGGYMIWTCYGHHVTLNAAGFLAKHSSMVAGWRLPGLHLNEYHQVLVVARAGAPTGDVAQLAEALTHTDLYPELTAQQTPCYELPVPVTRKSFVFTPKIVSPEAALTGVLESGMQFSSGVQMLISPERPPQKISPVIRPRGGQLALILAAGLFNGLVLETDKGRMAVRSKIDSVETMISDAAEVDESNEKFVEREVYRTQSVVTISLLGDDGSVDDISGDGPIAGFIKTHKARLLAYLDEHFAPLYNFDYSALRPVLLRSKGGKLYKTQKHVVAACHTALQHRKSVILVGEPGVGKSILGATLAVSLKPQMKPGQVDIIMSPPHLVKKWEREVKEASKQTYVKILENTADVSAFMRKAEKDNPGTLYIGILSREKAKAGEGWEVAVHWRKRRITRWPYGSPRPMDTNGKEVEGERVITLQEPHCPGCGWLVEDDSEQTHTQKRNKCYERAICEPKHGQPSPATQRWLSKVLRYCNHCGQALWTQARTFSKGKQVNGKPKNPRVPLAQFIAQRYPGRVYLYAIDELHECKSSSTDQGEAMMILANAATKTVGLTGTLYGGTASSLYAIEYIFNPRVRQRYPWGKGLNQFVADMGCLERTIEYRPQYDKAGVYTGKRRTEQAPKEAPGTSPLLVSEIIDHCVFVGLKDVGKVMPTFEEIPVPISPDPEIETLYAEAKKKLGQYLFERKLEGDSSALGMYLQTLLSWPNAPYREERCIHNKRVDRESDEVMSISVHTIPAQLTDKLYAKEQWLMDILREELAQQRGVAVFVRQTGTRDIQPRLVELISKHVPQAKQFVLKGSVEASKREDILNAQVANGVNVLICNPRLVQTGLDLLAFPTIIFFETDYSLYVTGQASRRAWRLIQDKPCKTYYPFYEGLMENQAVELIGRKQQAAALLYGETSDSGLSSLSDAGGGNLVAALAAEIDKDVAVTDLTALFSKHAHEVDAEDGVWFSQEQDNETLEVAVVAEPKTIAAEVVTPEPTLLDLLVAAEPTIPTKHVEKATVQRPTGQTPTKPMLPPKPKAVRRKHPSIWDIPMDAPVPTLQMLAGQTRKASAKTAPIPLPILKVQQTTQLSLF
jgi:hypothetical protein